MTLLVAISGWEVDPWVRRFRHLLPGTRICVLGEPFDRRDVLYAATWRHPPGSLAGLPNLEVIFSLGAGVDHLIGDARLPDVPVVRIVDPDLTNRMSEYVVLHCLSQLRQQRRYQRQQAERIWEDDREQPAAREIRVGIMGLGVLGQDAAAKLALLGFDVAGWSRSPKQVEGLRCFSGADGLTDFLARTDILVCLLPLTEDTRHILDRSVFERLARDGRLGGPVLINAGRGGLQVEEDILACLGSGTLGAAVLDVFETEPLPASSPLWDAPNLTITPHNSAMSSPDSTAAQVAGQIRVFEAGGGLTNLVDVKRGY